MITELDKMLYDAYKEYMRDDRLSITMQLYDIKSIEDFKSMKFYNILYKEAKIELRKIKLKNIV